MRVLGGKSEEKSNYEKLVLKGIDITLEQIIQIVKDEFESEYIKEAIEGDIGCKKALKNELVEFLNKVYTVDFFKENNRIDKVINQYHLDYSKNMYLDEIPEDEVHKKIYQYFEKFILGEHSSFEDKYRRLINIIYQENYGLSVIDEMADDYENINELWTNSKDDIYIQFHGVKVKLRNCYFKDITSYENVIKNSTAFDAAFDISQSDPIVFCSRKNGSRVTAIFPPVNVKPCLNIRNFNESISSLENLVELNTINQDIKNFLEILIKGRPNFSIIGAMGSGKTTFLRALMSIYDPQLSYLTIEPSDELRLYRFLKDFDIRSHIYSKKNPPDICLEASYRENRDIIIQGEIRTSTEAYNAIYVKNKVAKGSGDTYHANGFEEYMITRRNLLMETGKYQNYHQAEIDLAYSEDIIYIFKYNPKTGYRYLDRISELEILKAEDDYRERVLIRYDENDKCWYSEETISEQLAERLLYEQSFTRKDLSKLNKILADMKKAG